MAGRRLPQERVRAVLDCLAQGMNPRQAAQHPGETNIAPLCACGSLWLSQALPEVVEMAGGSDTENGPGENGTALDAAASLDTGVPHVARVYNYWLGGTDNFEADRVAGERAMAAFPAIALSARSNRAFLARAVRFLVEQAGVRQFLDIGTGIPSANNTHEVAQAAAPQSRVVYVDKDPIVATHARALLAGSPEGFTSYVEADLRDPRRILDAAAQALDFGEPVALMLMAMLQHVGDDEDPYQIVATLMGSLPPGSYLTISHPASDIDAEAMATMAAGLNQTMAEKVTLRDRDAVARFFTGLDLVEPGLVQASKWRPASEEDANRPAALWAGVGLKK